MESEEKKGDRWLRLGDLASEGAYFGVKWWLLSLLCFVSAANFVLPNSTQATKQNPMQKRLRGLLDFCLVQQSIPEMKSRIPQV
jgi:hypothetical protein